MSKDIFGKLLQDAKELPSNYKSLETPQLNRGFDQIAKEMENLNMKYQNQEIRVIGKRFLADVGIDPIEMDAHLNDLRNRLIFEKKETIKNTDVEAYLNKKKETYVAEIIEESKNANAALLEKMNNLLQSNEQKSKSKILEEWDLEKDNELFGRKLKDLDTPKKQVPLYAMAIKELNQSRLLNEKMDLVDRFSKLSHLTQCTGTQKKSMQESYDIMSNLIQHSELQFYSFAQGPLNNIEQVKKNRILVQASKSWLEKQYLSMAQDFLNVNAVKAQVGGSPSLMHRLRTYVLLRYSAMNNSIWAYRNLEVNGNTPIWLFLYTLLRCGQYALALRYVQENTESFHLSPEFPACFKEYIESPNHRLSEESRLKIFGQYKIIEYVEHEDPYKVLIYKIIGRCHLHIPCNPNIVNTIEDSIWYHLSIVQETVYGEARELESYQLSDLQDRIIAIDPRELDKNGLNSWFYFNILLLTCQFERAIDYLHKHHIFRLEAVHFGIMFAYYGLIRIPGDIYANVADLLVVDLNKQVSLNFPRLLYQYIQLFLGHESIDALDYLCLFTLYPTEQMKALCYDKIANFIASYSNYKEIIGEKNISEGKLIAYVGIIGIQDITEYKEKIIYPVAEKFKYGNRRQDSISVRNMS